MRKILTSILGVAGLLAVVLALASGPATAAKDVITITSDTAAGTYIVTWSTKGNCDPGFGASGATGSVTLTVADSGDGTGTAEETGVVTDTICRYEWEAVLVKEDGSRCKVADITITDSAATLAAGDCNSVEKVTFTVAGYTTPATGSRAAVPPTAAVRGAIKNTAFTVTATEKVPSGAKADPECAAVSDDTEVGDAGDNQVELTLVDATFNGRNCTYTVTAALPTGFAAGAKGSNRVVVVMNGPSTATSPDPANNRATLDKALATPSTNALNANLAVTVATRTVYLVQNVIGDAGGVGVEYEYSASCGAPGLPGVLKATGGTGGIITRPAVTVVELRQGRFNVSAAIGDHKDDGTKAYALDEKAEACEAAVTVSGVPEECSVEHNSPVDLVSAGDSVIIEFTIDCTPGAAEAAGAGDAAEDAGAAEAAGAGDAGDAGAGDAAEDAGAGEDADVSEVGDGAEMTEIDDGANMTEIGGGARRGPPQDVATG